MTRAHEGDRRPPRIPAAVRAFIRGWRPARLSTDDHVELVRRAVSAARPQRVAEAINWLEAMAEYVACLCMAGVRLRSDMTIARVFDDPGIDVFDKHLNDRVRTGSLTTSTRRTWLSATLGIARRVGAADPGVWTVGRTPRGQASTEPVSDKHFAEWLRVAATQSSPVNSRFTGLLLACRGAGASTTDMRYLRGKDVRRRRDGSVSITVPGPAARDAVVLDRYADQLLAVARGFGDDLIVGTWPHRNNPTSDLIDALRGGHGLPRPMPRPLRMAYVVEMLHTPGLELTTLRAQLGGASLSELESALPFVGRTAFGNYALRRGGCDEPKQAA